MTSTLTHSEQINEIATALAKAQAEMEGARKSGINPHFRSKYADLASVWDAVRAPLTSHGISVVQAPCSNGTTIGVETLLMHSSGQWIRSFLATTAKDEGPQAAGSCITYLRRYALQSFAGVAPEDDDGNAAEGRNGRATAAQAQLPAAPPRYEEFLIQFSVTANQGLDALRKAYKDAQPEHRDYLTRHDSERYKKITDRATAVGTKTVAQRAADGKAEVA